MLLPLLALVVATMLESSPVSAQMMSIYAGRTFLITFPDTLSSTTPDDMTRPADGVHCIVQATAAGTIRIQGPGLDRTYPVAPNASRIIPLQPDLVFSDPYTVQKKSYSITSDVDIVLYCAFWTAQGSEAFTPLPVERWGTSYVAATGWSSQLRYQNGDEETSFAPLDAPSQIVVLAAQENTRIRFRSTSKSGSPAEETVVLNAGQSYVLEALLQQTDNLTGISITSDKPIGVLSGNTRSLNPRYAPSSTEIITGNTVKNCLVEWLHPVELHGSLFSAFASSEEVTASVGRDYMFGVATAPGNTVIRSDIKIEGVAQYQFSEVDLRNNQGVGGINPLDLVSDRPMQAFYVTGSFQNDAGAGSHKTWTSAMAQLEPHQRWGTAAKFYALPEPRFLRNFVLITAERDASVRLDGNPVPLVGPWGTASSFRHARVAVEPGDHVISSTGGTFTAIAFGMAPGSEELRPQRARRKGDAPTPQHSAIYMETPAYAYAYPVAAFIDTTQIVHPPEEMLYERVDGCNWTVLTIRSSGQQTPIDGTTFFQVGENNVIVKIDSIYSFGHITDFAVMIRPYNPSLDAITSLTVREPGGKERTFLYEKQAHSAAER